MKQTVKVTDKYGKNPFWIIESLPDRPLFQDCPVKPPQDVIDAAEDMYLKFSEPPTYISSHNEQIIFEWNYYRKDGIHNKLYYSKELIFKDAINLEWRDRHY